ncbi:hypothetical protein P692DRAFT_20519619 [Suillus brevipes Sb2]|nr:hypothetical protein P692DRAFT_20519619 [Suillus brevipes Sb2]
MCCSLLAAWFIVALTLTERFPFCTFSRSWLESLSSGLCPGSTCPDQGYQVTTHQYTSCLHLLSSCRHFPSQWKK